MEETERRLGELERIRDEQAAALRRCAGEIAAVTRRGEFPSDEQLIAHREAARAYQATDRELGVVRRRLAAQTKHAIAIGAGQK